MHLLRLGYEKLGAMGTQAFAPVRFDVLLRHRLLACA
jgi:hypothetical protein